MGTGKPSCEPRKWTGADIKMGLSCFVWGCALRPLASYCHHWEEVETYLNYSVRHHGVRREKKKYIYIYFNTAELQFSGLIGTASHPDMQKIRKIGFFLENMLHWQVAVQLLLFTVCTCV